MLIFLKLDKSVKPLVIQPVFPIVSYYKETDSYWAYAHN